MREESPAQPSPAQPSPAQPKRQKQKAKPTSRPQDAKIKFQSKKKNRPAQHSPAQPKTSPPPDPKLKLQKQKQNPSKPPKTRQNPPKPPKTPDPNPIQFLSPHKEGAIYLDDDRSRPCRRFLQNRFVCLLLKHNPFKSRAQPRANQSPRAHSEPTARSPQPENKSKSKTWQNPAKLRTQTLYNFYPRIKKALSIWTMIDLGLAKGFSKTALCVCC